MHEIIPATLAWNPDEASRERYEYMTSAHDDTPLETAAANLSRLRDLGARAWQCWMLGDRRGAMEASNTVLSVAAAATAALSAVIDGEADGGRPEAASHCHDASDWLG
ncbi:hypothetical protein AB0D08_31565 [Kitasatospora sp. NPDC048540]|uniref:hypothetical protein n=1 Tax=unclassified Kitasatospora TaxID=2633591 RepID=UPI0011EA63FD|nr:hypothetical protein [Kitasatospora sp. MBT63]